MGEFTRNIDAFRSLSNSVDRVAEALELWALMRSHLKLAEYIRIGTINHPEVRRAPVLMNALLENLAQNVDRHVDVNRRKIFDEDIAGKFSEIRAWQETGYSTERTESNYPKRVLIWQCIYEHVPLVKKYKNGDRAEFDLNAIYHVSYESIIEARMDYAGGERVPYWLLLNYGTDIGPLSGYPNVPGIHFLERAEATIPINLALAEQHLDSYFTALMNGQIIDNVPVAVDSETGWLLLYGKAQGEKIRFAALNFRTGQNQTFLPSNLPANLREFV